MIKLALVVIGIGSMIVAAIDLNSDFKSVSLQAHPASLETDAEAKIKPVVMTRSAPHGLPQENWPLH